MATAKYDAGDMPSKKQLKKKARYEEIVSLRKLKRADEKKRRKERAAANGPHNDSEHISKRIQRREVIERCKNALVSGQRIAIDLNLESAMTAKERSKLAQQLGRLYGVNRASENPSHLYFVGFDKEGEVAAECHRKLSGFENYMVDMTSSTLLETFAAEDVVYLSPDADSVLWKIDKDKVYVLGGLVDETRLKGYTKTLAQKAGVETARLPIQELFKQNTEGTYNKILAVNQVLEILLSFNSSGDWQSAIDGALPKRSGFLKRTMSELDDEAKDNLVENRKEKQEVDADNSESSCNAFSKAHNKK